jgi:hypothetical protein
VVAFRFWALAEFSCPEVCWSEAEGCNTITANGRVTPGLLRR